MFNEDLQTQIDYLEKVLTKSHTIAEILKKAPDFTLPNWYDRRAESLRTIVEQLAWRLKEVSLSWKLCPDVLLSFSCVFLSEAKSVRKENVYEAH